MSRELQVTPESPRLDSAVDGNGIQGCMDWNLDQDDRQDNRQKLNQKEN